MSNQRLQVVDALRGIPLAGIVLIHMLENYIGGSPLATGMEGTNPFIIDDIVSGIASFFIRKNHTAIVAAVV